MSGGVKDPLRTERALPSRERWSPARRSRPTFLAQLLRHARAADVPEPGTITEGQRTSATLHRDSLYRRLLALADVASVGIALALAASLLGGDALQPAAVAIVPFVVLAGKVAGIYDRDELLLRKTTLEEVPALFQVTTLTTLIFWLGERAFVSGTLEKAQVIGAWALLMLAMLVTRALARAAAGRMAPAERCLVLGDQPVAEHLRNKIDRAASLHAEVLGRVPITPESATTAAGAGPPVLGPLSDLDYVLRAERIDRVIIALGNADSDKLLPLIRLVKALGVKVSVLPRLFEVVGSSVEFDDVHGATLLGVRRYGLTKSSWYLKRTLDVAVSSVGLLLFAPVLIACAVTIKIESRGPVFFRQPRIGRKGVVFNMLKLRTMVDGADERKDELRPLSERDGLFKISRDPRVTRVGRLLRRTCLDELPQLFNVLRGDMSLVGPRPLVAEEAGQVPGALRRHEGTPGMTGAWQVLGGADISLEEMVNLDYLYRANWSLWLDIKLLLRTIPHVIRCRGL